jgi:hypothetical protein
MWSWLLALLLQQQPDLQVQQQLREWQAPQQQLLLGLRGRPLHQVQLLLGLLLHLLLSAQHLRRTS